MFDMLSNAIEKATSLQLKTHHLDDSNKNNNFLSNVVHENTFFTIELHLQHGTDKFGAIDSNDSKILHALSRHTLKKNTIAISQQTQTFSVGYFYFLGFYVDFSNLIKKKIYNLIDFYYEDPTFEHMTIKCYRDSCNHVSIFKKYKPNGIKNVYCQNCHISDFCLKCGKIGHYGECNLINSASDEWINNFTKKCPQCKTNIQKIDGCNHITCYVCHIHFCWLCSTSFKINEINEHYNVNNSINPFSTRCIGLLRQNNTSIEEKNDDSSDLDDTISDLDDMPDLEPINDMPDLEPIDDMPDLEPIDLNDTFDIINIETLFNNDNTN
jgi:hypothetical protein